MTCLEPCPQHDPQSAGQFASTLQAPRHVPGGGGAAAAARSCSIDAKTAARIVKFMEEKGRRNRSVDVDTFMGQRRMKGFFAEAPSDSESSSED